MWLLKLPILAVTIAVWAVVGFLFWIPLLARTTAMFSVGILYATLTREDPAVYGHHLHTAIGFYPEGFRKTLDALYPDQENAPPTESDSPLHVGRLVLEAIWAGVFWLGILFTLEQTGLLSVGLTDSLKLLVGKMRV